MPIMSASEVESRPVFFEGAGLDLEDSASLCKAQQKRSARHGRRDRHEHTTVITREVSDNLPRFRFLRKKLEPKLKLTRRFIEERHFPGYALHRLHQAGNGQ